MSKKKLSKLLALYLPYVVIGLLATNLGEAWRLAVGKELGDKIVSLMDTLPAAFSNPLPSLHPIDLFIGLCCGAGMRLAVYLKGKNAKKYRHGMEYGSARWGGPKDIEPFMAPKFEDNIILTKTERLMMSNRPPDPKNARNKNVLVVGGSGSGKTRFWLKPNAARVKYDAALHDLSSVDADLKQIQNRLARLSDCESQYQAALSEKIKSIKVSAHPAAQQIAESESRIAALKVQKRELLEAINAGKTALHTVNEVLETLDNAEGWSTWDVMGGGLMADLAKYEELDDAQKQIEQLQVELRRFKTELADVEITADLQVTVDSFLKFADFFFDGLFADWAVLDHINQAQSRVENTKGQIKRVLALLKKMREDVDVQIADEKEKQEQLAVETEL